MVSSAPEPRPLLVYATVLYWQARELPLLPRCVASLLAQEVEPRIELRVLLIDNGCGAEPSIPPDPRLKLVHLPENQGFAGGHNVGLRCAFGRGADFVLLFNSDAEAQPGMLGELLAAAHRHPAAAFLGPLLLRARAPERLESAGQAFNPWTGRHTELERGRPVACAGDAVRLVDAVSGCVLLARRQAVEAIGLLDEGLFAYFEDMDWCLRARRAGYQSAIVPRARAVHVGQASTGSASPLSTYYSVRNHVIVATRYGQAAAWLLAVLVVGYHVAFLARSLGERGTPRRVRALAEGAWDAWQGSLGARQAHAHRH